MNILLDSNLIIYLAKPQGQQVAAFLQDKIIFVSAISKIEVLGYHALSAEDKALYEQFFNLITVLPVNDSVINKAVYLRRSLKMHLGDAIIAATASVFNLPLGTNNTADFEKIKEIELHNPLT